MLNSVWDQDPLAYSVFRQCWLNERRYNFLKGIIAELSTGDTVVEIGSGTGDLLFKLAKAYPLLKFIGIDPIPGYISFSNQRIFSSCNSGDPVTNLAFYEGSAENCQTIVTKPCRLILSNDMIHHVDNQAALAASMFAISDQNTEWIAIEPNFRNPYTFLKQASGAGERNFYPASFCKKAFQWECISRQYLFLIPPFIKKPPIFLKKIESRLEGISLIAGGIALKLKPRIL